MKINITVDISEYDESFRVRSGDHESIPDALAEVLSIAESQKRLIQDINYWVVR